ncbi:MAG: ABC transporter ATP-binding protein [Oscillospiraceae bacterium]|nr:ABC transporter ATP-binding protein [Oscillospiraceae bacterium]
MKEKRKKSLLGLFVSYFRPHWKLFLLDVLCAMLIAAIDLSYPLLSRHALNVMLPGQMYRAFFTLIVVVLAAYVLRSLFTYIIAYWGHTFGIRVEADIRKDLYSHFQTMGFDFYDRNRTGQLMSRLTSDLFELTELAHHGPEDLLTSVLTIIGALIVMFTVEWRLALVVATILPIFLAVVVVQRKAMRDASREVKKKIGVINTDIETGLSGIRTAKAFANETMEAARFDAANNQFKTAKRGFHKAMGRFFATMEFFLCILSVAVIAVGGYLIMKGQMNYVDLITFNLYIATFTSPMRKLANFSEMFASGFAGLQRFADVMELTPSIRDAEDAAELQDIRGEIEVDHVTFAYDGDLDVLEDVSLKVRAGETVAVVGPSGGGKTTLCQLVPRFYDVTEGAIRLDGKDVRQVTQQSLRRQIGIVQQDVFLFADSIMENIRYGRPDATDEEVIEAAKKAEIYDDICQMPNGFDTYVGERGTLLSGGQKQRVSIARIFLKNPPVLILDEATSALDSVTEAKIQRAFDTLSEGRTTLIIAHRLSTIRNAERIVVIADGKIAESGSHGELVAAGGMYAALYETQTKVAREDMA